MVFSRVTQPLSDAKAKRWTRPAAVAAVLVLHAVVLAAIGLSRASAPAVAPQAPIEVELFEFAPPPPPPPPDPEPAADPGGGAPAAASRVNRPPDPPRVPPELPVAPPTPAPQPTLIVGASPTATLNTGLGQGGEGAGTDSGTGAGDGPGAGSGPIILRGASNGEILAFVPPEARRRRISGRASVNCVIRSDTRLEGCRPVEETPAGLGFGDAAVRIAETHFRFRPPSTASGRPVEGFRVTVFVQFGRQG
jgi:protein TonB